MQEHRTRKKKKEDDGEKKREEESEGRIFKGLRGLLESQTYELSEGGEVTARHQKRASNPQVATVSRIASRLADKLPGPVPDQTKSRITRSSESREEMDYDSKLEAKELMAEARGGPGGGGGVGRTSSSGSDSTTLSRYGSISKHSSSPPRTLDSSDPRAEDGAP